MEIKIHTNKIPPKNAAAIVFCDADFDEVQVRENGSKVIRIGMGKDPVSRRKLILLFRKLVSLAKVNRIKQISINFGDIANIKTSEAIGSEERAELLAENAEMANFEFVAFKTEPKEGWNFITDLSISDIDIECARALSKGQTIGRAVNHCRTLANTPGGDMTPETLAASAIESSRGTKIKVSVLKKRDIEKLKMGGILGVSRGSNEEPRFIIMEYSPVKAGEHPIVLVGKGITFDTGGLNLKSSEAMYEMHMDMSGGAAVIHSIVLAAKLGIKKNIVGLIPAVENMPSGSSYHPGDLLRTMSGKTIEVINTDAEGRIVLADALTYAERYDPRLVVDVATLTGAIMAALGQRTSGIFSKDEKLIEFIRDIAEKSGDYVWPMPLWDEYEKDIKGTFGDWANSSKVKYGGAITGALFLYQFAKKYPWVHIDIASRMTATDDENLAKGAAGAPVRLLIKLLESY
jgi:leucyl aminopeptidase